MSSAQGITNLKHSKLLLACLKQMTVQTSHWAHTCDQQPPGQKGSYTFGNALT